MSDYIFIEGLEVDTVIGVLDWEREIKQRLVIDLRLNVTSVAKAAKTDDIRHTLDYAAISKRVVEYAQASSYQLIETMAERLAVLLLREFSLAKVKIKVSKPGAVPASKNVAVEIKRADIEFRARSCLSGNRQ